MNSVTPLEILARKHLVSLLTVMKGKGTDLTEMSPTLVSCWVLIQTDSVCYNQVFCLAVGGFLWLGEA
ncbi:Uncharacterized protein DAT39_004458 [Clarias magur]|uniref:Uncharacterized protein n=1 Tax=Clarias magur TaxID=1594786 RepID=A0A8J4US00_CLAMG|nr:Uncharacterized protein DAT39_004458 [Clarias magur]